MFVQKEIEIETKINLAEKNLGTLSQGRRVNKAPRF
jgi:hypothetical protein